MTETPSQIMKKKIRKGDQQVLLSLGLLLARMNPETKAKVIAEAATADDDDIKSVSDDGWVARQATVIEIEQFHHTALLLKELKAKLNSPEVSGVGAANQWRAQFKILENNLAADLIDCGIFGAEWIDVVISVAMPANREGGLDLRLDIN